MNNITKLTNINFNYLGNWIHQDEAISHTIKDINSKNFLYAFIVDEEVKYIGKSQQTIKQRFSGYIKPGSSQTTNIKNNKNIKNELFQNKEVKIYIFIDNTLLKYGDFNISLSAGLEDDLIKQIKPPWNGKENNEKPTNTI